MPRAVPAHEVDALVDALERAVDGGDRTAVAGSLRRLADVEIYSDRHHSAYTRLRTLKPRAVRALHIAADVDLLLEAVREEWVYSFEVWAALDPCSATLPIDDVVALAAVVGVPSEAQAPELVQALVQHPDDTVTSWLEALIDEKCGNERDGGGSFTRHTRAMSTFRFIRWHPDDGGLAHAVAILVGRRDARAVELTARYARSLPWGEDRRATHVLFGMLSISDHGGDRDLIRDALGRHRAPGALRLLLLGAFGEFDADAALAAAVSDLTGDLEDEGRIAYLDWLAGALAEIQERGLPMDRDELVRCVEALDTRRWTVLARGHLGVILGSRLSEADPNTVSARYDRGLLRLIQAFSVARLDHMGCMISLPVLFGLGELILLLLDVAIGTGPPRPGALVDDAALVAWLFIAAATSHTHFSGNETLRSRLWGAVAYFGTLAAFLVVAVMLRA